VALLGNQSVLNKGPGRNLGGNSATTVLLGGPGALGGLTQLRPNFYKSGPARARFTGEGGWYAQSAVPDGYRPPYTYNIAVKDGAMARFTYRQDAASDVSGLIAGGLNAAAELAGTGTISSADLALVVSAAATITAGGSLTGNVVGKLELIAALAGSADLTAGIGAIAHASADIEGTGNMSATVRATGELTADIQPFTELSPESLARAVWTLQQAGFTDPGTFGANLDAPISTIGGGSITEEGIAEVLMTDPRFLSVAKFLGLK
jgi:hypothetical protein